MALRFLGIALIVLCLGSPAQAASTTEDRLKAIQDQLIDLRLMRESLAEQTAVITRLQKEIAGLRGQIDVLRHRLKELDRLAGIEARLNAMATASTGGPSSADSTGSAGGSASGGAVAPATSGSASGGQTATTGPAAQPGDKPSRVTPTTPPTGGSGAAAVVKPPKPKPPKPLTEKGSFAKAKDLFVKGRMKEARQGMLDFLAAFPASSYVPSAMFWIGETYYQQKRYEEAILEYQRVIQEHPKSHKIPSALLKQAFAFAELKDTTSARLILRKLIKDHSRTPQAKIAKKKLQTLN